MRWLYRLTEALLVIAFGLTGVKFAGDLHFSVFAFSLLMSSFLICLAGTIYASSIVKELKRAPGDDEESTRKQNTMPAE